MPDITVSFSKEWYIFKINNAVVGQLRMTEEPLMALVRSAEEVLGCNPRSVPLENLRAFIRECELITPINRELVDHLGSIPRVSRNQESEDWYFYRVVEPIDTADGEKWKIC